VITLHNRVDVGVATTVPFPRVTLWFLEVMQRIWLGKPEPDSVRASAGAWRLLRRLARGAKAVIAPSQHFADLMRSEGVAQDIDVIPTGVDDDLMHSETRRSRSKKSSRPLLVWAGRMSAEKRLLEFLEALAAGRPEVDVQLFGTGKLQRAARRFVERAGLGDRVRFMGQVPYPQMLSAIARADALVQTSRGFETQGLTISEAIALGTPVVLCDPAIASELPQNSFWLCEDGSVDGLAEVLQQAASDLAAGSAPAPSVRDATMLLESTRVAELERVYERVLAEQQSR
jgi:1,2-diacylglycerol 3-alpha-glucosyltransferase